MNKIKKIIGITGSLGSGCTTIAKYLTGEGYSYISISNDILSDIAQKHNEPFTSRKEKQTFGNNVRKKYRDEYKRKLLEIIEKCEDKVVIECFRNPIEIDLFRDHYPHFYLFAIFTPFNERKIRKNENDFKDCNKRDEGEKDKLGQQVRKCVKQADIVLDNSLHWRHNDDKDSFFSKVDSYLELLNNPYRPPTHEETSMHLAYSVSLHSQCIQRQVGAVITDGNYRVLSVGYNDVPHNSDSCFELYSRCSRKIKDKENIRNICKVINCCPFCGKDLNFETDIFSMNPEAITDEMFICNSCKRDLSDILASKNLDYCRSLHAEENAILLNPYLSDRFREDMNMIIFTTTFPCMLCAKKIANSGIKKLVFVEPYPIIESHDILKDNGVEIKIFEGVKSLSFNWIFRNRGRYLKDSSLKRQIE